MTENLVQRRGPRKIDIEPQQPQSIPFGESGSYNNGSVQEKDKEHDEVPYRIFNENVQVNKKDYTIMALIFAVAAAIRFYRIDHPHQVVFDEVHFGKFAAFYLRREYFFDVHPPLAKLMIAFAAWVSGFDGQFEFENIGDDYIANNVPYIGMRALPAIIGSLLCPVVYAIMRESGHHRVIALLSTALVMFDNAHVAQSRLILLDAQLVLFMALSIYAYVKFHKLRYRDFTPAWWTWLTLTGIFLSLTLSCKMVGLLTFVTIGVAVLIDLWGILDIRRGHPIEYFWKHFLARALCLIFVPFVVYLFWFYVHFKILIKSGNGDDFMSPRFQESLIGSPLTSSSRSVQYYDVVELKHKQTKTLLHSHTDKYPLKYDDGRISSRGQQVTGYPHNDTNNHWMIVPTRFVLPPEGMDIDYLNLTAVPGFENLTSVLDSRDGLIDLESSTNPADNTGDASAAAKGSATSTSDKGNKNDTSIEDRSVYQDDVIRLYHVNTGSFLMTHDVASPLLATNQEFTTWPVNNIAKRYNDTLFQMTIDGGKKKKGMKSKSSQFKLTHIPTRVALWTRPSALPDWAHGQQDVNGNKNLNDKSNLWLVNEIVGRGGEPFNISDTEPQIVKPLNFFSKYFETQISMLQHNSRLTSSHPYASGPINWPFLLSGISFWTGPKESRQQIYMVGNVISWWYCIMAVSVYTGVIIAEITARRRGIDVVTDVVRKRLFNSTGFFVLAWLCHFGPFFLMGRQLFLHHYLPAHVASALVGGAVFHFIASESINSPISFAGPGLKRMRPRQIATVSPSTRVVLAIFIAIIVLAFIYFSPLTYGTPGLSAAQVKARKVLSTWTLHYTK